MKNERSRQIPAAYILTVDPGKQPEDDNFAPSGQRARERGWDMFEMPADHNPQWSSVHELVELLVKLE